MLTENTSVGYDKITNQAFSIYTKLSKKLTFLPIDKCAYQGVRNVSFSENFKYYYMDDLLAVCQQNENHGTRLKLTPINIKYSQVKRI